MSEPQPFGDVIDSLGVKSTLADGDLVSDVIVISKVIDSGGRVRLNTAWSEGMSWIERLGMLHAAVASDTPRPDEVADQ